MPIIVLLTDFGITDFQEVPSGTPVSYAGSSGFLEIALNNGNAQKSLSLGIGDMVRFS
jgi:S-adenosylmethionine hydrolase